jgi:vacuolar-type H+-ATPase subunit H
LTLTLKDFKKPSIIKITDYRSNKMAVEALKIIREGEEEGRKLLEEAKASVANILNETEQEVKRLKEREREDEKSIASEISAKYIQEGKKEEAAIMTTADTEVEQLKAVAESNLESAVNVVLERILGVR